MTPSSIVKKGPRTLAVEWVGGETHLLDVVALRRACVCAQCVDEFTRQPILKPEDVPETTRPVKVKNLGRYALVVDWNDGHNSIFSWEYLYDLGRAKS